MKVENYIKAKMNRALKWWNRAQEAYKVGEMQLAANYYAEAMQLYCACAKDLIDGVGFVDEESEVK